MLLGVLALYVLIRCIVEAATRPFVFDELLTLTVASQAGLKGIWNALSHAVDGQPPLFYWLESFSLRLVSNKHIALRLPSILAMVSSMILLFVYLKKRNGERIAFLCASFLLLTSFFRVFATNGRPYSLLMVCLVLTLICYRNAQSPTWTLLFGVSLVAAEALHYYAVFGFIPFGLAEAFRLFRTGKFRWGIWFAMAFGTLPLIVCWPLLASLKGYFGSNIWSHFGLSTVAQTYGIFLGTDTGYGTAIAVVLFATVLRLRVLPEWRKSSELELREGDPVEGIVILGLVALPLIDYVVTAIMRAPMRDAYALGAVIGISLGFACALSYARQVAVTLFALFIFSALGIHEFSFWRETRSIHNDAPATSVETFVQSAGAPNLPIVISGLPYLTVNYYASPEWTQRFVFLTDRDLAVKYLGHDNMDKGFQVLRQYMPLHLSDFNEFTSAHPEFLLYAEEPGSGFDWIPYHLTRGPWTLQVLATEPNRKLYLVTRKKEVGVQ